MSKSTEELIAAVWASSERMIEKLDRVIEMVLETERQIIALEARVAVLEKQRREVIH